MRAEAFENYRDVGNAMRLDDEARRNLAGCTLSEIMGPELFQGFESIGGKDYTITPRDTWVLFLL